MTIRLEVQYLAGLSTEDQLAILGAAELEVDRMEEVVDAACDAYGRRMAKAWIRTRRKRIDQARHELSDE